MKPRIFISTTLLVINGLFSFGQQWIGTQFSWDTSIVVKHSDLDFSVSKLKYCIDEGTFYYADMRAYQNPANNHAATFHALSLYDYAPSEIILEMPFLGRKKENLATTFWIYDFHFTKEYAVVSTQDQILLYHRTGPSQFVFDTIFYHKNTKATYIYQDSLYYLEEDHDLGYKWFRQSLKGGDETLLRELAYEAPHVVQANPNRYLFHNNNFLFFLSTRYPVLHKYSLNGEWLEDISFDLPNWHPFEDEYIQKSLAIPYGVERIYATMAEIFQYSYPKYVFPFGDSYLLYYTQYDTISKKSTLQYAIRDEDGNTTLLQSEDTSTLALSKTHFPFNLFNTLEDKAHISWNNLLLEITADDTTQWIGRKPSEYKQLQEQFYKQNDPLFKIRILRHKNNNPTICPFFIDSDKELHSIEDLNGKNILLISNQLECSACRNKILQLFNDSVSPMVHIGILHPFIPGALHEHELRKSIMQHLERPFMLFYLASNRFQNYPKEVIPDDITYPAIMLYETGRAPILFSVEQIFSDDVFSLDFKEAFLKTWRHFNKE